VRFVSSSRAPAAIGPYSQGVVSGRLLYVSGQIAIDPASGEVVDGDFSSRVRRVLDNLDAVLQAGGSARDRVLKVRVYLTDMARFAELNQIYGEFFASHRPARAVVEVSGLPKGVDIEIELEAEVDDDE
jgi:2-iminobutanoate/2-iminopropanoate deaminase